MKIRRRYRAAGFALAGVLVLTGCGGDDSTDPEASGNGEGSAGGEIVVKGCKPAETLIPSNTVETCGHDILDTVLGSLVRYDKQTGEAENDIAESIETEDSVKYTIKLKRGIKFHDGTEVKAKNFVDAWNYAAYAPNAQLGSTFLEPIKGYKDLQGESPKSEEMSGLKVVDDYEFTATMAQRNSTFSQRLGYTTFAPLPDSFFEEGGDEAFADKPIGAGPMKIVSVDPERETVVEKDPTYDRVGKIELDKITFRVYDQAEAAYSDLLGGQLDLTYELPTAARADKKYEEDLGEGAIVREVTGAIQTMTFPSSKATDLYEDPKLRQAISMAIDRQQVIDLAFGGTREPATGWVAPVVEGYAENGCGEFCTYNPDKAKQLYDESSGIDEPITIAYNADSDHKAWVDATCNSIKNALDVECNGKAYPRFADFRKATVEREEEGMFRSGWVMDYPLIENFLIPLYSTGGSSNEGDYSNAAFDRKLKEAAAKKDLEEGYATYQEAEKMLVNDMPAIPLWYYDTIGGFSSDNVAEAKLSVFGHYDFTSVKMK